jgi:cell division protein ZapE
VTAFLDAYQRGLETREIEADPDQSVAVEALERLTVELSAEPHGLFAGLRRHALPCGIYLWGSVGRGKSMLMDLFCRTVPIEPKRRVHFHAFMEEVHAKLNSQQGTAHDADAITGVAAAFRQEARLLCLDELEIVDITDAVLVGRLFEALAAAGIVIVATSNDAPDDLYRDGPNRDAFLPFVELLKTHMREVQIGGSLDRRDGTRRDTDVYFCPINEETTARFDAAWTRARRDRPEAPAEITTHGRTVRFARAAGRCVRVTFEEACAAELSADDHNALAARFDFVFLEGLRRLDAALRDEARRLVTLVDALYEARVRLTVLADVSPEHLFADPTQNDHQRTASRLKEMRGDAWPPNAESASRRAPPAGRRCETLAPTRRARPGLAGKDMPNG